MCLSKKEITPVKYFFPGSKSVVKIYHKQMVQRMRTGWMMGGQYC